MFRRLVKMLKSNKPETVTNEPTNIVSPDSVYDSMLNIEQPAVDIPEPAISGAVYSRVTMLVVDDQDAVFYLYDSDFNSIKDRFGYDVHKHYKIVKCSGPLAGGIATEYIRSHPDDIVIGLLDLTLGSAIRHSDGTTKLYDGVDIALSIIMQHPKCKLGFCTAHMLSMDNPAIYRLHSKFMDATGHNLLDYSFSKNSDRASYIYGLIKDVNAGEYTDYALGDPNAGN